MKYIYTSLFIAITLSSTAQFKITTGYSLSLPQQEMSKNINMLHSLNAGGSYQLPGKFSRIQIGADFTWGTYANTYKKQTFTFRDGSTTTTMVDYSSNVLQGGLNARVLLAENKAVLPYINAKVGYSSFYSNIYIEDPNDPGGCKALDQSNIIKDGTFTAGYGGGMQIDWGYFSKRGTKGRHWVDISANNVRGGKIEYINTKKLYDANNPPTASDGKALNVKFINASTNEIHEHQVAEVFTTPLRMMEIKVAAVFALR
jgi:opacity protein-like surface antigen